MATRKITRRMVGHPHRRVRDAKTGVVIAHLGPDHARNSLAQIAALLRRKPADLWLGRVFTGLEY